MSGLRTALGGLVEAEVNVGTEGGMEGAAGGEGMAVKSKLMLVLVAI